MEVLEDAHSRNHGALIFHHHHHQSRYCQSLWNVADAADDGDDDEEWDVGMRLPMRSYNFDFRSKNEAELCRVVYSCCPYLHFLSYY